jgi:hypothetical protein
VCVRAPTVEMFFCFVLCGMKQTPGMVRFDMSWNPENISELLRLFQYLFVELFFNKDE